MAEPNHNIPVTHEGGSESIPVHVAEAAGGQAVAGAMGDEGAGNFDHLWPPEAPADSNEDDTFGRDAASQDNVARYTELLTGGDAADALRQRAPQPPLTPEQIRKLVIHRGQHVTEGQIAGMNAARAAGIHTSIV